MGFDSLTHADSLLREDRLRSIPLFSFYGHVIGRSRGGSEGPIQTYPLCWCHLGIVWVTPGSCQPQFSTHPASFLSPVGTSSWFYSLSACGQCSAGL